MALSEARRSVSDANLLKYGSFAQNLQQQRGQMLGGATSFRFGESANAGQRRLRWCQDPERQQEASTTAAVGVRHSRATHDRGPE